MEHQVLAVRGVGGYRQYRIPAMAVTPSGRIITIYDGRFDFDDLPGPVDLVIRTSDDNGTTWSPQSIFRKHEGIAGFGDASIIIDPNVGNFGRIIVLYQSTKIAGFFESKLGSDLDDPLVAHIGRSISDDDGISWRHEVITEQLKDENTPGIFATSGMGAVIPDGEFAGRLLQTFVLRRDSQLLSAIGYSDDHGENWQLGALIPGGNETAIAGFVDGSVLVNSRATPFRLAGKSIDGGKTLTWLEPDLGLPDPSDNGSIATLKNGDVICTHNHDCDLRRNTVLKRSHDGGRTWITAISVEPGSSAYSTACELTDGSIGVLYERNAYQEIVFSKSQLAEFRPIDEVLSETKNVDDIEFTVIARYIRPARDSKIEDVLKSAPLVPNVDMSAFQSYERKEVGGIGGSTSGDSLFTSSELNQILGEISPGLHLNDEIRFSVRITNERDQEITNVRIMDRDDQIVFEGKSLASLEKICLLDIRQLIQIEDLQARCAVFTFQLSAEFLDHMVGQVRAISKVVKVELPT